MFLCAMLASASVLLYTEEGPHRYLACCSQIMASACDHCHYCKRSCNFTCRSSLSAALLQGNVTGRYASAPDLQALVAESNTGGRGIAPDPIPARARPPRSPATKGVSRSLSSEQSHAGQKPLGAIAYSDKPLLRKASLAAVASPGSQHVLQTMQKNEQKVAVRRQLQRNSRVVLRNWGLLLVLGTGMMNVFVCLKVILWS